jgi:hypothetical protein
MRNNERFLKQISWCLLVSTALFLGDAGELQAQQGATPVQDSAAPAVPQPPQDKSAAVVNEASASYPDAPVPQGDQSSSQTAQDPSQSGQSSNAPGSSTQNSGTQGSSAQAPAQDQNNEARPLGTAAAPAAKPSGVTGSRPAGAVIAPGKQRRTHAILISVALVAAAAIAVGTVAALSSGTPSRP